MDARLALGLLLVTVLVFARGLTCDWVYYDDATFVLNNPDVRPGLTRRGVAAAFAIRGPSQYHPLTWLSHMLDCQWFGAAAWGHHLTSVILHAVSAALAFLWVRLATATVRQRWLALSVAAWFALHPLRVESVVWIAERKDVLCVLWALATLVAHAWHARRPSARRYMVMAAAFTLCLASKPSLVGLPLILLALDVWPLRRVGGSSPGVHPPMGWRYAVIEKLPLLALSGLAGILSFLAQRQAGTVETMAISPLGGRIANALVAVAWYVGKLAWPTGLAVFYPFRDDWPMWQVACAASIVVVVTGMACWWRQRWPWLLVGWLWFGLAIAPSIGLVQVGSQGMADRYTYFPSIGLKLAAVWAAGQWVGRDTTRRRVAGLTALAAALALAAMTWRQIGYWQDGVTLFTRAVAVTRTNALSQHNLAAALARAGRDAEAKGYFEAALAQKPDFALAHGNYGALLVRRGEFADGLAHLGTARQLDPASRARRAALATGHVAYAAALAGAGQSDQAEAALRRALAVDDDHVDARMSLGMILARRGDLEAAAACYVAVLAARPDLAQAHNSLGVIRARQGRMAEALSCFQSAIRINPTMEDARANLERALAMQARPGPPGATQPKP